jgi:cytochrome c biogenesis protein CcmG/thiol:disulfide interchange protein DsbE
MASGWSMLLLLALLSQAANDPETRVVEYLKAHVRPGQPVVVSNLYNQVFTAPEERAALERLFNTFFKIPLFVAQFQRAEGRPPTLAELSEQFGFEVPGEADVLLRIMDSDPRMPRFLERDPATGEITKVDVAAITAHPRFGKLLERSLAGLVGKPAPPLAVRTFDGTPLSPARFEGKPHLVYFWFTGCPPCLSTTPLLVKLREEYVAKGFEVVAVNADRVLGLPYTDEQRKAYVEKLGIPFPVVYETPEVEQAWGPISVFPTLFFVDRDGIVAEQLVAGQDQATLTVAIERLLAR